ncbi:MAG: hypothetical protein RL033_7021, partial [Pseudomonadota bacterium]
VAEKPLPTGQWIERRGFFRHCESLSATGQRRAYVGVREIPVHSGLE